MLRRQSRQASGPNKYAAIPRLWLFSDERNDQRLEQAIARLPKGSGIIFRHYHLENEAREERLAAIVRQARRNRHTVLIAGPPPMARRNDAAGVHGRQWSPARVTGLVHSAPVHNIREVREANMKRVQLFFLSPVHATRSHPGQRPTSRLHIVRLARLCRGPVVLLGGMNAARFRYFAKQAHGWGAIDALS